MQVKMTNVEMMRLEPADLWRS